MRHSDISLTMNTYTDERLLETSAAVERLPHLPLVKTSIDSDSSVAPTVAPDGFKTVQKESFPDIGPRGSEEGAETRKPRNPQGITGFYQSGRQNTVRTFHRWPAELGQAAMVAC